MTISFIGSKSDLVAALKKAAKVGGMEQLKDLAEYIKEEVELNNLKEQITFKSYKMVVQDNTYKILEVTQKFDPLNNLWIEESCTTVQEIPQFLVGSTHS